MFGLHKIFVWRARRRERFRRYKLDQRHYPGVFGPGFLATMNASRFWDASQDRRFRPRRVRRRFWFLLSLVAMGGVAWWIWESAGALVWF